MSEDYGANIVSLTDEEGVEHEFEHIDTIEFNGKYYLAFIEANAAIEEDAEVELIILRADVDENGEEILSSLDSEEEYMAVYEAFIANEEEEQE